jgi:hypothetical protein
VREAKQVQTSSGTERKGKALLVDCEAVHDVSSAVKEFTTQDGGGAGR